MPSRSGDSLEVQRRVGKLSPMPRTVVLLLHLAYWLIYFCLLSIVLALVPRSNRSTSVLALLFTSPIVFVSVGAAVPFYLAYGWLFSAFLTPRRIGRLIVAFVSAAVATAIVALIGLGLTAPAGFSGVPGLLGAASIVLGLAIAAGVHQGTGLILRGFVAWHRESAVKAELTQRNREMELALIRARIDPHFLFNTLNNVDVLIARNPRAASEHLVKLCELLRFVLYEANAPVIPLAAELDYVEKYVALERTRTANPTFASFEVVGDVAGVMVSPMLIIPLIENAFKHADHVRTGEAIRARLTVEQGRLTFLCRNLVGTKGTRNAPGGLGNELMQRRMELLYPGRHRLEIVNQESWYTVTLTVDLNEPALHHR